MKIHSAVFYSNDLDSVKAFYEKIPGFELEYESDGKFLSYFIGNEGRLGIKKAIEHREVPGHQSVFIEIENILELFKEIEELKIDFAKRLTEEKWATEFSILDPDGNKLLFRSSNPQ